MNICVCEQVYSTGFGFQPMALKGSQDNPLKDYIWGMWVSRFPDVWLERVGKITAVQWAHRLEIVKAITNKETILSENMRALVFKKTHPISFPIQHFFFLEEDSPPAHGWKTPEACSGPVFFAFSWPSCFHLVISPFFSNLMVWPRANVPRSYAGQFLSYTTASFWPIFSANLHPSRCCNKMGCEPTCIPRYGPANESLVVPETLVHVEVQLPKLFACRSE